MHQSFLVYRQYLYLRWALALSAFSILLYIWHEPVDMPNGGSWLGYTLGVLGTGLIAWLTWFGVRKRSYTSTHGTVQGWLSAHVYLGMSLVVIATLHSGFQFGWNVHTLAYALMLVVVLSGMGGVILYRWCPRLMTQAMRNASRRELLEEVDTVNASILALASSIGGEVHDRVLAEFDQGPLSLGDTSWLYHRSRNRSSTDKNSSSQSPPEAPGEYLYGELSGADRAELAANVRALLTQFSHKQQLVSRLTREAQLKRLLTIWLLIHVPASIALIAALLAHIVSVFMYW